MTSDKERYREERKKDALLYITMLVVISGGFYLFPMFSPESLIPTIVLTVWGLGIARRGYLYGAHLEKIEPELKQMVANGMSEHDAMLKLGCNKYHYKPFWAIK